MSDQLSKQVDMQLIHHPQGINEQLQLINVQVMFVNWVPKVPTQFSVICCFEIDARVFVVIETKVTEDLKEIVL